ncbi:MAG: cytochrome c family protein [Candidatus Neomarinimicrobiota bacterium]
MIKYMTVLLLAAGFLGAQDFEYIGTKKCKACHSSAKKGAQYKLWLETGHAKAFDVLFTDEAIKIAQERKLTVTPDKAPECVECHVVGFGAGGYEILGESFWNPDPEDKKAVKAVKRMENLKNVGCEVCHGAGSAYRKKKVMDGIYSGTMNAADHGLTTVSEKTCLRCHNDRSPSFKSFDYAERSAKIAHPYPEDMQKK